MPKFLDTITEDKKELKAKLKKLDYEYYKAKPAEKDMIMKKRLATLRLIYGDAVDNTFVNKIKVPQTEKNITCRPGIVLSADGVLYCTSSPPK